MPCQSRASHVQTVFFWGLAGGWQPWYGPTEVDKMWLWLAIANELVKYGFSPDAVGVAVREIPESKLSARSDEEEEPEKFPLLVCVRGDWEIWKMHEVDDFLQEAIKGGDSELSGIFLLDFQREVNAVEMKMAARAEAAAKGPKTSGGPR